MAEDKEIPNPPAEKFEMIFHRPNGTKLIQVRDCKNFCSALIIAGGIIANDFKGVEFNKVEVSKH